MSNNTIALIKTIIGRKDLFLVLCLIMMIALMILPLPTPVVDSLIAINIGLTVLLLLAAIYLSNPLSVSTFPSIILVASVFRLSLSISTTRLILIQSDAGTIIETFGEFVVSGNVIVGLVIFLIITVVQFVVITKGAERIAEVTARFTLDALPGKQMSIDADVRAGDITAEVAREKRALLDKESKFFGAMDGAMKFVKGDAIAGLVIIFVNILGGIGVGMLQKGLSFGESLQIFTLLTVGDGLVAQIPALFVALCAGIIVTRITTEESRDLGSDIIREFSSNKQSLRITALIMVLIGLVPGFPLAIFIVMGAIIYCLSYLDHFLVDKTVADSLETEMADEDLPDNTPEDKKAPDTRDGLLIRISSELYNNLDQAFLRKRVASLTDEFNEKIGLKLPTPGIVESEKLSGNELQVVLDTVTITTLLLEDNTFLLMADATAVDLSGLETKPVSDNWNFKFDCCWVDKSLKPQLDTLGAVYHDREGAIALLAQSYAKKYVAQMISISTVSEFINEANKTMPALTEGVSEVISTQKMLDIVRRLLEENIPISPTRLFLEALSEWGAKEDDSALLTEYVRVSLKRQICNTYADDKGLIAAYLIDTQTEEVIRNSINSTVVGSFLALNDIHSEKLIAACERIYNVPKEAGEQSIIVASMDLRRYIRRFLIASGLDIPVMSFQEITPEFRFQPLGHISIVEEENLEVE